ncbi:carboxypeptidase-like regulatory domain-containing protein [Corallococcus macrosporus]|uniref:carboxypeptidase-like regulatory domain-containing protein n=1 Tax=Corallococcus macrosporus TaxID=35 RepID=UPI0012FDA246
MEGKKAPRLVGALLPTLLASSATANPGSAALGTVTDARSGQPVADVVVTASAGAREHTAVTGHDGGYRLAGLPPGGYTLRLRTRALRAPHRLPSIREGRSPRVNVAAGTPRDSHAARAPPLTTREARCSEMSGVFGTASSEPLSGTAPHAHVGPLWWRSRSRLPSLA